MFFVAMANSAMRSTWSEVMDNFLARSGRSQNAHRLGLHFQLSQPFALALRGMFVKPLQNDLLQFDNLSALFVDG